MTFTDFCNKINCKPCPFRGACLGILSENPEDDYISFDTETDLEILDFISKKLRDVK
jgi:hypothetical protein